MTYEECRKNVKNAATKLYQAIVDARNDNLRIEVSFCTRIYIGGEKEYIINDINISVRDFHRKVPDGAINVHKEAVFYAACVLAESFTLAGRNGYAFDVRLGGVENDGTVLVDIQTPESFFESNQ